MILVDEQQELGGTLLANSQTIGEQSSEQWLGDALAELRAQDNVTLLSRSTVFGYYDHNYLGLVERRHLNTAKPQTGASERLWRIRAKQVVLATGAIERPLVFADNDRPGVMLAGALRSYVTRFGVAPGKRAVITGSGDSIYADALALAGLINDATYGVPGITASPSGAVVTLTADDPNNTEVTVTNAAATITAAVTGGNAYVLFS